MYCCPVDGSKRRLTRTGRRSSTPRLTGRSAARLCARLGALPPLRGRCRRDRRKTAGPDAWPRRHARDRTRVSPTANARVRLHRRWQPRPLRLERRQATFLEGPAGDSSRHGAGWETIAFFQPHRRRGTLPRAGDRHAETDDGARGRRLCGVAPRRRIVYVAYEGSTPELRWLDPERPGLCGFRCRESRAISRLATLIDATGPMRRLGTCTTRATMTSRGICPRGRRNVRRTRGGSDPAPGHSPVLRVEWTAATGPRSNGIDTPNALATRLLECFGVERGRRRRG